MASTNFTAGTTIESSWLNEVNNVVHGSAVPPATQTALDLKAPIANATFTGTTTIPGAAITGGSVTGITDLAVADGGTGSSTAAGARTNLGSTAVGDSVFTATSAAAGRTALGFTGAIIDRAYAEYTANANLTTILPVDDTIPQDTEGTQILSVTLTPKSVTNRVRIRFRGEAVVDTAAVAAGAAIFSSASANALRSGYGAPYTNNAAVTLALEHEYVPGVTTALTFSVRAGPGSAAAMRFNGTTASRVMGGAMAATLVIEEIAA